MIGGSCSEFSKPLVDATQWAGAGSNISVLGYRSYDPALSAAATYPNFIRAGLRPAQEAETVYRLLAYHNLSSVGVLCSGARALCVSFDVQRPVGGSACGEMLTLAFRLG